MLGQPKVGHVHVIAPVALGHEDVVRLDISVDQPLPVSSIQTLGRLRDDIRRSSRRKPANRPQQCLEVEALDETHREVQTPIDLAEVIDIDDVRMINGGGDPRLPLEQLPERRVRAPLRRDHLQRNRTPQPQMARSEHHAHAALA